MGLFSESATLSARLEPQLKGYLDLFTLVYFFIEKFIYMILYIFSNMNRYLRLLYNYAFQSHFIYKKKFAR